MRRPLSKVTATVAGKSQTKSIVRGTADCTALPVPQFYLVMQYLFGINWPGHFSHCNIFLFIKINPPTVECWLPARRSSVS